MPRMISGHTWVCSQTRDLNEAINQFSWRDPTASTNLSLSMVEWCCPSVDIYISRTEPVLGPSPPLTWDWRESPPGWLFPHTAPDIPSHQLPRPQHSQDQPGHTPGSEYQNNIISQYSFYRIIFQESKSYVSSEHKAHLLESVTVWFSKRTPSLSHLTAIISTWLS